MLEVRIMGGRQWHDGVRPIFRGGMTARRHENLHGGTQAACSVACLEWLWWIMEQRAVTKSEGNRGDRCVKPGLQKRLGSYRRCRGKLLDCR